MISIVLAEDHDIVREGFYAILQADPNFRIVGQTGDGLEASRLVETLRPNVLVADLMMPGLNGLSLTQQVRQRAPNTRIVILSMHDEESYVAEALRCGAMAYVLKDSGADKLKKAISEVVQGRRYLGPPLSERSIELYMSALSETNSDPWAKLTTREREVLQLTMEGLSSKDIGERLSISHRTVEKHRDNLARKLDVRGRTELVRYALENGFLSGQ